MFDPFLALADCTRREILLMLARQPRNAGDVARAFAQQRPAISKHLAVLREAGLVVERRERQQRIYSLSPAGLLPVRAYLGLVATEMPGERPGDVEVAEAAERPAIVTRSASKLMAPGRSDYVLGQPNSGMPTTAPPEPVVMAETTPGPDETDLGKWSGPRSTMGTFDLDFD